jgi:glucose/arabinose dehydrogenase
MLYLGWGDGGGGYDQHGNGAAPGWTQTNCGNGQDKTVLFGKIHRIDTSKSPLTPVMWDWGLRNPWRFSFDGCTADLYIGDVGQVTTEEIDVEPAGQGGKNYGWRCFEGNLPTVFDPGMVDNSQCPCDPAAMTPPVLTYDHTLGCAVMGGFVYRGSKIPGLRGTYFFADHCSGRIWTTQWANGSATAAVEHSAELGTSGVDISSFGQDANGEMYLCDHGGGTISRIDAQ